MAHLIDKSALVAEIERRIKYDEMVMNHDTQITELLSRELNTLYELSSFIKSLEVKEVDLEKPFEGIKIQTSMESGSLDEIILTTKYKAQKGEEV